MIELTDRMRAAFSSALADGLPVMVATASRAGLPDIAFKGSAMVWDQEHLAYWERGRSQTVCNLEDNPHVCLLYHDPHMGVAWKFFGVAQIHREGSLRDAIMQRTIAADNALSLELLRDPERRYAGVLIRVDRVMKGRQLLMQREE